MDKLKILTPLFQAIIAFTAVLSFLLVGFNTILNAKIKPMQEDIKTLKTDVTTLKTDVTTLKTDVAAIKMNLDKLVKIESKKVSQIYSK
ncbi:MAG: hypothetical protein OXJ52_07365 [Oligoflexia bacterium]|nr:hypothetical protein [Oligoflexia bacterium]